MLASAASEDGPAASGEWFCLDAELWSESLPAAEARPMCSYDAGSRTTRVNPPGTYAQTGGIDGHLLVLQIAQAGRSRLALYDLLTHELTYLPSYINKTARDSGDPTSTAGEDPVRSDRPRDGRRAPVRNPDRRSRPPHRAGARAPRRSRRIRRTRATPGQLGNLGRLPREHLQRLARGPEERDGHKNTPTPTTHSSTRRSAQQSTGQGCRVLRPHPRRVAATPRSGDGTEPTTPWLFVCLRTSPTSKRLPRQENNHLVLRSRPLLATTQQTTSTRRHGPIHLEPTRDGLPNDDLVGAPRTAAAGGL